MATLSLDADWLCLLFPAHLLLDEQGTILRIGPSLRRHLPGDPVDQNFFSLFRVKHPYGIETVADFADRQKILVNSHGELPPLQMRGMVARTERAIFLLLGHAPPAAASDSRIDLKIEDFGPSDAARDMMYAAEMRQAILADRDALTVHLKQKIQEAEQASIAKSRFLATMSHEIRTPLNGVIGLLTLMQKAQLQEDQQEQVSTALRSAESLLVLLNDVLDISKIDSGNIELDSVAFSPLHIVNDVVGLFEPSTRQKGIAIQALLPPPEEEAWVSGDMVRVRQILLNLVGNAVKFTLEGGVKVRLMGVGAVPRGNIGFEVEDTGIGIPEAMQSRIFESFHQADASTTRRFGGTGLGLAISKKLVELMGGRIGVQSTEGQGSRFWITIPVSQASAPDSCIEAVSEGEGETQNSRPMKILVAEDNEVNQIVIREYICAFGHEFTLVENGEQAIEAVRREPFDLILMDVQMPVMDGLEATKAIRQLSEPARSIPIIALTANAMSGDREHYMANGMTDYVPKPIDSQMLKRAIVKATAQGTEQREDGDRPLRLSG